MLVYSGQHAVSADFTLPTKEQLPRAGAQSRLTLGQAYVALSIEDVRGIRNIPKTQCGGQPVESEQGYDLVSCKSGLHAPVALAGEGAHVGFTFELGLDGIEKQSFVLIAKNNQVSLKSSWPHPQFGGRFLPSPKQRRSDRDGFGATWIISSLASIAQRQLRLLEAGPGATAAAAAVPQLERFSVGFIAPVNVDAQADRATKYGLLYGALYGLLNAESNALVMGSILLFALLAAPMVATRQVDWHQIGRTGPAA